MMVALRSRWGFGGLLALAAVAAFALAAPAAAAPQDDKGKAPAAAPAPAPAKPGAPGAEEKVPENWLLWAAKTSGPIGLVILGLSIYMVATIFQLFRDFQQVKAMPPALVTSAEDLLEKKDFGGVYNLLKEDKSYFARAVTAGLPELQNGIEAATEAVDRHAEVMTVDMEKRISMLAVIGTLGPMIGLLGTLSGMIKSFGEIARSGSSLDPGKVAEGISEALLLTFEGVGLSLPAIYFFTFFKNRVMSITANTTLAAHQFLRKFYGAYKQSRKG